MNAAPDLALMTTDLPTPNDVRVVSRMEDLDQIRIEAVPAVILDRELAGPLQDWLDQADPDRLPEMRAILRPDEVRGAVETACDDANTPRTVQRDAFVSDVCTLADAMVDGLSAPFIRLRLNVVRTNSCRKFHVDAVTARLVCTYRGAGTQYGVSIDGADPDPIFDVPTGAPILLRGTEWPVTPDSGLRHRSPPIEGTGQARLVLVIDPIFDPEDEV